MKLSTTTYLTGVCYDLNDTEGDLQVKINGIYVFALHVSLNPLSGDINLSNLSYVIVHL